MTNVPDSGPIFEAMMRAIDSQLSLEGKPIAQRPIHAMTAVARRFKIPIPLSKLPPHAPPELHRYEPLREAIARWYDETYSHRLKQDAAVGKIVVLLDNDIWRMEIPVIFGGVRFYISRNLNSDGNTISRGPINCNILDLIETLTPSKAKFLSDADLQFAETSFGYGLKAHYILSHNQHHKLIKFASGDVKTAVDCLMDRDRYGESKWASLQAAEKAIKAAIQSKLGKYPHGHRLKDLCEKLTQAGIVFNWQPLIDNLQCTGGIRYGEESCTRDQALLAHLASLQIIVALADSGANFANGLE